MLGVAIVIGIAAWHGFHQPRSEKTQGKASAQQPSASVTVVTAKKTNVPVELTANGYVSSLNSVDIRPQVTNIIGKVHIKEGQFVKAGDILFSMDDRANRVNLQKAEAQVAKDKASLADLERQLTRSQELVGKGFISQSAVDTVRTQVEAQRATMQADTAAVEAARVALSYDTIRASSAGRAGAISVFPGSLVQPSSPPLVTISQLDPIAATFTIPESELSPLLAAQREGSVQVTATLQNTSVAGRLSFVDNTIDPQNGTVKVKAVFPNKDQLLWPGQYVAIKTAVRELKDAIVIPQAAVITGVDSSSVYVVNADKTAQQRRIQLVYSFGAQAVVQGIQPGESIVVDGKQNLRPGTKVRITEAATGTGAQGNSPING